MLSSSEIELLSNISEIGNHELFLHDVAERLDWSDTYVSRVISGLENRDYLQAARDGRKKSISINEVRPVEQLANLANEYPHIDFAGLLGGSALAFLYYLDTSRTASELADLSRKNRKTVYRRMKALQNVGIVRKNHSKFQLTTEFKSLSDLARSVAHHEHRQEALTRTNNVTIIWETLYDYLFACGSEVTAEGFHPTGPAVFKKFGIPLLTRDRLHYLRSDEISGIIAPDLVCHTLLIDDGARYRSYCLLLIAGQDIDQESLSERAEYYDSEAEINLVELIESLVSYLETEGEDADGMLPAWEDFKATATDYDIAV